MAPERTNEPRPGLPPWKARLPNALTLARLALAALFFVTLSRYNQAEGPRWALVAAAVIFVVAAVTDALDGMLARRWGAVTPFGRVLDPAADKLLVLGAFVLLASPAFLDGFGEQVTGVAPWMVIVIIARELLSTSVRAVIEGGGGSFPANRFGKAKMILQSLCVPVVLLVLAYAPVEALERNGGARDFMGNFVWATVIATILSGWPYLVALKRAASDVPTRGTGA